MLKGFKDFILRGNVVELAVAVIIGAAFGAVVNSLVEGVFNPLIGALFNADNLKTAFPIDIPTASGGTATLLFGSVIAALINFLIVAFVVYFAVVVPINYATKLARQRQGVIDETAAPAPTEVELLAEIRDSLKSRPLS